jgi:hypothetical protein
MEESYQTPNDINDRIQELLNFTITKPDEQIVNIESFSRKLAKSS